MNNEWKMITQQELLLTPLQQFFKEEANSQEMEAILLGTSPISLRIIDWYVTNYSKKYNTSYLLPIQDNEDVPKQFIVYLNYKSQLKAYSKKQFDPFCRKNRIDFRYGPKQDKIVSTTVGQLNFFRWAIQYQVIENIKKNLKVIESDMNQCIREIYGNYNSKSDKPKERRKRREISLSATRTINKHNVRTVITFT